MNIIFLLGGIFWITLSFLYAYFEGSKRKPGFWGCLVIMILFTPFFGYFIIESFSQKKPKVANGVATNIMRLNIAAYAVRMRKGF